MNPPVTSPSPTTTDPGPTDVLEPQRAAAAALGHELRTLIDTAVRTEAPPDVLHRAADAVRRLTGQLTGRQRTPGEIPATDEFPGGMRTYSPATGPGSPLAPPMHVTPVEGGLSGTCAHGIAHEGPPGYGPATDTAA